MDVDSYPLRWPDGYPRTPGTQRRHDHFRVTTAQARSSLYHELQRLDGSEIIISTNVKQLSRGSTVYREPVDPGVAVYFQRKGKPYSLACDRYHTVLANLRGLAATISALRAIERHGSATLLERAFTGFAALPPAGGEERPWHLVLELPINASVEQIKDAYRKLAMRFHPDHGSDGVEMAHINRAYEEAMRLAGVSQ